MLGDLEVTVVKAAMLAAEGKNQQEIARALGDYSQSAVSRLLKRAHEEFGILLPPPSMHPTLVKKNIPAHLYRQAEQDLKLRQTSEKLERELHKAIAEAGVKPVFQRARIVDVPQPEKEKKKKKESKKDEEKRAASWQQRGEIFGRAAAERFVELLDSVKLIGILHGRTIKGIVDVAEQLLKNEPARPDVRFVPLSGEPFFLAQYDPELTATELSMKLRRIVTGQEKVDEQVLLRPVPAVVPMKLVDQMNTIYRLAESVPAYLTIFGPHDDDPRTRERALVSALDAIVTGVAGIGQQYLHDPWFCARLEASGLSMKDNLKYIAGDISGVVLPREDLETAEEQAKAHEIADGINKLWLGVQLRDLKGCAERAAQMRPQRPGVLVVAYGASKARVLVEAIRSHGCISEIMIDNELMQEMLKELAKKRPRRKHRA